MSDIIIGIDLGTTNSEVAVVRDGRPEVIAVDGSRLLPSVVGLGDDGTLLVGQAAHNQYVLHPDRTVKSIKRRMGEDTRVTMGHESFTPQEISALILGRLKRAAEDHLGETITRAVITVPAYFSDAQRQATRDAGQLAGLEVMRIINEPTAAALAYEVEHVGRKHILVYDLGGGTFDVSVVGVEKDVVEVLGLVVGQAEQGPVLGALLLLEGRAEAGPGGLRVTLADGLQALLPEGLDAGKGRGTLCNFHGDGLLSWDGHRPGWRQDTATELPGGRADVTCG